MEKFVAKIAAFGVPGLVLLVAVGATGLTGAAALTAALAALGPGGMIGGIALLGIIGIITHAVTEFGFDAIFSAVVRELLDRGESKESMIQKVRKYPLSKALRAKLIEDINHYC